MRYVHWLTLFFYRGGLDGGAASLGGKIGVEFYTKDRVSYLPAVEGAKQEKVFG